MTEYDQFEDGFTFRACLTKAEEKCAIAGK